MAIEIVSFPINNGGSFHSYVSLPEGTPKYSQLQVLKTRMGCVPSQKTACDNIARCSTSRDTVYG